MSIEHYAIYEVSTGNILQWGTCGIGEGALNTPGPGRGLIYGDGGPWASRTHCIAGGSPVPYTPAQVGARAVRPSRRHHWSNASMTWEDQSTLAEIKATKWSEIKAARAAAISAPLATPYGTFDADPESRAAILHAATALAASARRGRPVDVKFTLADNSTAVLVEAHLDFVIEDLHQRTQDAYETARTLRAQIETAATPAEIAAITWP